ncbi:MAG: MbnP family protein [Crocinitomicaceae bacterium]
MRKRSLLYLGFISLFVLGLNACKKDKPAPTPPIVETPPVDESIHLTMKLNPTFNGNAVTLGSTYTTIEGYPFQLTNLKFLVTNLINNGDTLISAAKLDWAADGLTAFSITGDPTLFQKLSGNLGVDSAINHRDPISFPTTDPLYLTNINDMHWGWNPGYIFIKVEGKYDTITGSSNFPLSFLFHIGMDQNKQTFQWNTVTWHKIDDKHYEATINFKLDKFLHGTTQSIDLKTENLSHSSSGQETLSLKVIQLFNDAFQAE